VDKRPRHYWRSRQWTLVGSVNRSTDVTFLSNYAAARIFICKLTRIELTERKRLYSRELKPDAQLSHQSAVYGTDFSGRPSADPTRNSRLCAVRPRTRFPRPAEDSRNGLQYTSVSTRTQDSGNPGRTEQQNRLFTSPQMGA